MQNRNHFFFKSVKTYKNIVNKYQYRNFNRSYSQQEVWNYIICDQSGLHFPNYQVSNLGKIRNVHFRRYLAGSTRNNHPTVKLRTQKSSSSERRLDFIVTNIFFPK